MSLLATRLASAVDRAVLAALGSRRGRSDRLPHHERLARLALVRDAYARAGEGFFAPPAPIRPLVRRVRPLPDGGEVVDLSWRSDSTPFLDELRDAYVAHEANRVAHARLFAGARPRPAVILVHGYLGGRYGVEEVAWPIAWMVRRGLDVALPVLPFHAARARAQGGPPPLPAADPRYTNEGFRQAIFDLRALAGWLRARGAPAVGVMGMSLGGYTTALLATVADDLAFAVPVIPLASIADVARDQGRLGSRHEAQAQHRALEEANRVVSPLARPGRVPADRVLVVGAEVDRITPIAHAERLARHFAAPLHRLPGSHLVQLGRGDAFRAVRAMWRRIGIVS
jgi:pimeloyl-ACP methyl ester carboxylesterase